MYKYRVTLSLVAFLGVVVLAWVHMTVRNSTTYINKNPVAAISQTKSGEVGILPLPASSSTAHGASEATTPPAPPPNPITASAYIVGNAETGQIYLSKNTKTVSPIASISKLFTVLIAYANMDPHQIVQITQSMLDVYPDAYGFSLGERFSLNELIYPVLIQSNNNIAEGIAQTYGYTSFIQKMNSLASSLGMAQTHFMDASGLSDGNSSDAQDLFTFAKYLYASQRPLLALTKTPSWTFATTSEHGSHFVTSTDPFIGDPHLVGGKTGRTDAAGETMLTIFNYGLDGKNYPIAIVVLHSALGQRENDSERLLFQAMAVIKNNP